MTAELPVLPLVGVHECGIGWHGWCSIHGGLPTIWDDRDYASLDALGHASAHHRSKDSARG